MSLDEPGVVRADAVGVADDAARFAAVFDAVRESIAVQHPVRDAGGEVVDYEIEWVNDAWLERYGWAGRDPRGHRAFDINPAFRSRLPIGREVLATGVPQRADLEVASGRWIEADYSRFGDSLLVVARDVTDRKHAQTNLAASEERYRIVVTAMAEGVVLIDATGRIEAANPAAASILGVPAESMVGRDLLQPDWDAIREDGSPFSTDGLPALRALRTGHRVRDEVMGIPLQDGAMRWILVNADPLVRPGDPEPYGVVTTFADITARRETEAALDRAQRMEMVGRLAAGVAHDFNNILTSINGYATILLGDLADDDPRRPDAAGILDAVDRAAALSRQLLAFGRRQLLRPELVDLDEVIAAELPLLRSLCGDAIRLRSAPSPVPARAQVDRGVVEQALVNLVLNARAAMPAGGEVAIETAVVAMRNGRAGDGRYVRVCVTDTGAGIASDVLPRIFDPFFTTKDASQGSGLGLSSVEGAVGQSGGFVTVDSRVGHGSRFAIHLPFADGVPVPGPGTRDVPSRPAHGTETVLVVEDEPLVRMLAGRLLATLGYQVVEADRPTVALAIAAAGTTSFDAVLTDLLMPEMDGRALAARLRELRPGLPVVFMSAYSPESVFDDALLPPGTPFLAKPFGLAELAAQVRAAIDGAGPA